MYIRNPRLLPNPNRSRCAISGPPANFLVVGAGRGSISSSAGRNVLQVVQSPVCARSLGRPWTRRWPHSRRCPPRPAPPAASRLPRRWRSCTRCCRPRSRRRAARPRARCARCWHPPRRGCARRGGGPVARTARRSAPLTTCSGAPQQQAQGRARETGRTLAERHQRRGLLAPHADFEHHAC